MTREAQINFGDMTEEDESSPSYKALHLGKSSPDEKLNRLIIQFLQRDGRDLLPENWSI